MKTHLKWLQNMLGINELSPNNDVLQMIGSTTCQETAVLRELCTNVLFLLAGYDSRQFNRVIKLIFFFTKCYQNFFCRQYFRILSV